MKNVTVQTIIVNYQTPKLTLRSAVGAKAAMHGLRGEITVVENASRDGSAPFLQDAIEQENQKSGVKIKLVKSEVNGGFGAGVNLGIDAGISDGTLPDFVYLLNSDAYPARDAILRLLEALEHRPDTGIAGSYIHGTDQESHLTAFRFPGVLSEFENAASFGPITRLLKNRRVPMALPRQTSVVDWLAGASMMIRREVIEDIGTFDEQFFLYFEETDFCRRAKSFDWATIYVPESRVEHVGSASTGMQQWRDVPEYWVDSRLHYFRKSGGNGFVAVINFAATLGAVFHAVQSAIRCRKSTGALRLALRQNRHFLRNLRDQKPNASMGRARLKTSFGRI